MLDIVMGRIAEAPIGNGRFPHHPYIDQRKAINAWISGKRVVKDEFKCGL